MGKARIKFRQMPGDIPKKEKIKMMEGEAPNRPSAPISRKAMKNWKDRVLSRERAVLKERARVEVERETEE